jgi:hypothetical protein
MQVDLGKLKHAEQRIHLAVSRTSRRQLVIACLSFSFWISNCHPSPVIRQQLTIKQVDTMAVCRKDLQIDKHITLGKLSLLEKCQQHM